MNDQRETKELITPLQHKVVIKTYLTAREADDVSRQVFAGKSTAMEKPTIEATAGLEKVILTLKAAIVSFDGVAEGAFDKLQDLPLSERNFVMTEFRKLAGGNF